MAHKLDEYRDKAQDLLREVVLMLSDINDVEERISKAKGHAMELFKKLDDTADGES